MMAVNNIRCLANLTEVIDRWHASLPNLFCDLSEERRIDDRTMTARQQSHRKIANYALSSTS